jgi:hypothetical protein
VATRLLTRESSRGCHLADGHEAIAPLRDHGPTGDPLLRATKSTLPIYAGLLLNDGRSSAVLYNGAIEG